MINPSQFETPYFIDTMNAIKQMNLEAKQENVNFFVVILPILIDVRITTFAPVYDKIKSLFTTYDIQYFDLSNSVSSYEDSDLWILPFDQHPNEVANAVFANRLSILLKNAIAH